MRRLFIILACLLLSLTASSQKFIIPFSSKKATKVERHKGEEKVSITRSSTVGSGKEGKVMENIKSQVSSSPKNPDLTVGRQVKGIERSMSVEELETLAQKGNVDAHTQLGMYYFHRNDKRALPHLRAGADAGDCLAQYYLGGAYYNGVCGAKTDKATAASYFLKSARQNHVPAQYAIAVCLYNGEGTKEDKNAAREWMKKAAASGDDNAKSFLQSHSFE